MALSNEDIDKMLESVLDYVVEYYSGGELVGATPMVAQGDDRAHLHFDEAFLVAHHSRQYLTADKMCLRSRLNGEMVCFGLHYERRK